MRRFRVKQLNLMTDVPWLKEGRVYDGDFAPMKDRMVQLRAPNDGPPVEVPLAWLEDVTADERLQELFALVQRDQRLHSIDVALQPQEFALHIGGPGRWKQTVEPKRLLAGDLDTYAREIVDAWAKDRKPT